VSEPPEETCPLPARPPETDLEVVELRPRPPPADYREALRLAESEARRRWGEDWMLLSWYDRDRDFEAPQHVSECHQDAGVPGYVDYALHRGARLKVDVDHSRFVFFFLPVAVD